MSEECKHFKFGYCRYVNNCVREHIKEICDKKECGVKDCKLRHPKKCNYFTQFGYCKFGSFCLYKHEKDDTNLEVKVLENKLKDKCLVIDNYLDKYNQP